MIERRWDLAEAQRLANAGKCAPEIAEALGVSRGAIYHAIAKKELRCAIGDGGEGKKRRSRSATPSGPRRRTYKEPPAAPVTIPSDLPARTASLIATGGRYADLARWAEEWGRTQRQALQEWHGLRLPVSRGAVG